MSETPKGVVFAGQELMPGEWRQLAEGGPVRMFNPALLADGDTWLFAYRVVASDGLRRIGLCRLDRSLRVIDGSHVALSDGFRFRTEASYPGVVRNWFADPRLYRFAGRVFVYWNSGWHEPQNHQFLHELEPTTLRPIGCARELTLHTGKRQKLEKNWTLFGGDDRGFRVVYSVTPHRILHAELLGEGDFACEDVANTAWSLEDYPRNHGGLRGGSPPQQTANGFLSFCHSVHDGATGYRYVAAAYRFSGHGGFAPTHRPTRHLQLHNPFGEKRVYPALNPAVAEVIYPCGAAYDGARWLVSHGINDEHCAISVLTEAEIDRTLAPAGEQAGNCALQGSETPR